MGETKYVIGERVLLELLASALEFIYLEEQGLDNWIGYDYVLDRLEEEGYDGFESMAREVLTNYKKVGE